MRNILACRRRPIASIATLVIRTMLEDRTLHEELTGYRDDPAYTIR